MALQKTSLLLNGSRPLHYLTRPVDYVHLKIRAADVKTNCSLFSIGSLHRHSGSCFTCPVLPQNWVLVTFDQRRLTQPWGGVRHVAWSVPGRVLVPQQGHSVPPSWPCPPTAQRVAAWWITGTLLGQWGWCWEHLLDWPRWGQKVSGISNDFATGKLLWGINDCNGTACQFRILKHFPFLTVGIWDSCEKYVLESIPVPMSVRDGNLQ